MSALVPPTRPTWEEPPALGCGLPPRAGSVLSPCDELAISRTRVGVMARSVGQGSTTHCKLPSAFVTGRMEAFLHRLRAARSRRSRKCCLRTSSASDSATSWLSRTLTTAFIESWPRSVQRCRVPTLASDAGCDELRAAHGCPRVVRRDEGGGRLASHDDGEPPIGCSGRPRGAATPAETGTASFRTFIDAVPQVILEEEGIVVRFICTARKPVANQGRIGGRWVSGSVAEKQVPSLIPGLAKGRPTADQMA